MKEIITIKANGEEYTAVKGYRTYGVTVNGTETAYTDEVEAINAYFAAVTKLVETEGTGTVKLKEYAAGCKIVSPMDWFAEYYNELDAELEEDGLEFAHTSVGDGEIYVAYNREIGYRADGTPYIRPIKELAADSTDIVTVC